MLVAPSCPDFMKTSFVAKMDSYYVTLFIMAMRLLKGDRYLSI